MAGLSFSNDSTPGIGLPIAPVEGLPDSGQGLSLGPPVGPQGMTLMPRGLTAPAPPPSGTLEDMPGYFAKLAGYAPPPLSFGTDSTPAMKLVAHLASQSHAAPRLNLMPLPGNRGVAHEELVEQDSTSVPSFVSIANHEGLPAPVQLNAGTTGVATTLPEEVYAPRLREIDANQAALDVAGQEAGERRRQKLQKLEGNSGPVSRSVLEFAAGALQSARPTTGLVNSLLGGVDVPAPLDDKLNLLASTPVGQIGSGAEQIGEFMVGGEATKGLQLGRAAKGAIAFGLPTGVRASAEALQQNQDIQDQVEGGKMSEAQAARVRSELIRNAVGQTVGAAVTGATMGPLGELIGGTEGGALPFAGRTAGGALGATAGTVATSVITGQTPDITSPSSLINTGLMALGEGAHAFAGHEAKSGRDFSSLDLKQGVTLEGMNPEAMQTLHALDGTLAKRGLTSTITDGVRSEEESANLGQTGASNHNDTGEGGSAVDIRGNRKIYRALKAEGFDAHWESGGQTNENGTTASGDHIHVNLRKGERYESLMAEAQTKQGEPQTAAPVEVVNRDVAKQEAPQGTPAATSEPEIAKQAPIPPEVLNAPDLAMAVTEEPHVASDVDTQSLGEERTPRSAMDLGEHEPYRSGKYLTDEPLVEHEKQSGPNAGETMSGVIATDLDSLQEARAIDPYAFAKDDGDFIHEEHVQRPEESLLEKRPQVAPPQEAKAEPEAQVTQGVASDQTGEKGQPTREVAPSSIKVDEARFQNRAELDREHVENIKANWNRNELDPLVTWTDPKTGEENLLAGHHRLQAALERGEATVPIRSFEGTEAEAIDYAKGKSNANRRMETPLERASIYRAARERGEPISTGERRRVEGKNSELVENLSHLDPQSKVAQNLRSFTKVGESTDQRRLTDMAEWIGGASRDNPELTRQHQNELYGFLRDHYGTAGARTKSEFRDRVHAAVERQSDLQGFHSDQPLNLEGSRYKSEGEREVERNIRQAQSDWESARDERRAKKDQFDQAIASAPESEQPTLKERRNAALAKYDDKVKAANDAFVKAKAAKSGNLSEVRKQDQSLFATAEPPTASVPRGTSGSEPKADTPKFADDALGRAAKRAWEEEVKKYGLGSSGNIDLKSLSNHLIITANDIRNGINDFADWSKRTLEKFGESVRPKLEGLWNRANEIAAKGTANITGMSHGSIETEGFLSDLPEIEKRARQHDPDVWKSAAEMLSVDPDAGRKLVKKFQRNPDYIPTAEDTPLILHERFVADEAHQKATDAVNSIPVENIEKRQAAQAVEDEARDRANLADLAAHRIGSARGAALRSQQWLLLSDGEKYSFARMERKLRAVDPNGDMSKEQGESLKKATDEFLSAKENLDAHHAEISQARFENAVDTHVDGLRRDAELYRGLYNELTNGSRATARGKRLVERGRSLMAEADAAMSRNELRSSVLPFDVRDIPHVVKWGAGKLLETAGGFEQWRGAMLTKYGPSIESHLDDIHKESSALAVKESLGARRTRNAGPSLEEAKAELPLSALEGGLSKKAIVDLIHGHILDAIQRGENPQGREFAERILEKAHADVSLHSDMSMQEMRDLFSDYGKSQKPSTEVDIQSLKELRRIAQLTSDIERVTKGQSALKTGQLRDKPTHDVRAMTRERDALMLKHGINAGSDTEIRSGLDRVKAALGNQIEDLSKATAEIEAHIARREQMPKPEGKQAVTYDEQASALRDKRNELRARRDELQAEHDKIFGIESKGLTEEQRSELAAKAADRSAANYARRLAEGEWDNKPQQKAVVTRRLLDARTARDAVKAAFESAPERQNAKLQSQIQGKMAKVQARLDAGGEPVDRQKAKAAFAQNEKTLQLQTAYDAKKRQLDVMVEAKRLMNRSKYEKTLDGIVRVGRFNKLTGIPILGKLVVAANTVHLINTMGGEAVGTVLSYVPGVRKIAERAPIEGRGSFSSAAEGMKGFGRGVKKGYESIRTLEPTDISRQAKSDNSYRTALAQNGIKSLTFYRDAAESVPATVHGALKSPAQKGAFDLAMQKQIEFGLKHGEDVNDPLVQMRYTALATEKAQYSIFQSSNVFTKGWGQMMSGLKNMGPSGQTVAAVGESLIPFMRPATNIPMRGLRMAFGIDTMEGAWRLINAYRKGIENLGPVEADMIMRHLKNGLIGNAAVLLGAFLPNVFGGFVAGRSERQERKKQGLLGEGSIAGLPDWMAHLVSHVPIAFALQFGATLRHAYDDYVGTGETLPTGFVAGLLGISKQIVFADAVSRLGGALMGAEEWSKSAASVISGQFVPGVVRNISQWTETPGVKRDVGTGFTGMVNHVKQDIPLLRQTIPIDPNVKAQKDTLISAIRTGDYQTKNRLEADTSDLSKHQIKDAEKQAAMSKEAYGFLHSNLDDAVEQFKNGDLGFSRDSAEAILVSKIKRSDELTREEKHAVADDAGVSIEFKDEQPKGGKTGTRHRRVSILSGLR